MLKIRITKQYKKDHKKALAQEKNLEGLKFIISTLSTQKVLPRQYKDHPLSGKLNGYRDCHIEADFILLYKIGKGELNLVRLGTHSEIFKK